MHILRSECLVKLDFGNEFPKSSRPVNNIWIILFIRVWSCFISSIHVQPVSNWHLFSFAYKLYQLFFDGIFDTVDFVWYFSAELILLFGGHIHLAIPIWKPLEHDNECMCVFFVFKIVWIVQVTLPQSNFNNLHLFGIKIAVYKQIGSLKCHNGRKEKYDGDRANERERERGGRRGGGWVHCS